MKKYILNNLSNENIKALKNLHELITNEFIQYSEDKVLRAHCLGKLEVLEQLINPDNFRKNMELKDVKNKIDNYFDNITPEEMLNILGNYGMIQDIDIPNILKNEINSTFFSPEFGEIIIDKVTPNYVHCHFNYNNETIKYIIKYGLYEPEIYPSERLYDKYGDDINEAWKEWLTINQPGRVHIGEHYYYIDDRLELGYTSDEYTSIDDARYKVGNYFKISEDAQNKIEEIKKLLNNKHV